MVDEQKYTSVPLSVNSIQYIDELIQEFVSVFEEKARFVLNYEVILQLGPNVDFCDLCEKRVKFPKSHTINFLEVIRNPDGGVRLYADYKCGVRRE